MGVSIVQARFEIVEVKIGVYQFCPTFTHLRVGIRLLGYLGYYQDINEIFLMCNKQ